MPDKINIYEYLDYLSTRWPSDKIQKLKKKLFSKGLIFECQCQKCMADQNNSDYTTGSGFN